MARPSKSTTVLKAENKSHRTKAELQQREKAEQAALTGLPLREVAEVEKDEIAHAEFVRVQELLSAVGKNDALYEAVINDYCLYKADISRYMTMREEMENDTELAGKDYYKLVMDVDKQIEAYRKKRFDIEKENGFTIASAARSIPKRVENKDNPLLEALNGTG